MRALYLSIIITVLGSFFVIGWGLDKLAESSEPALLNTQENPTSAIYRQLINGLTTELSALHKDELPQRIDNFQQDYLITSTLIQSENFALPQSLVSQLTQPGGLLLASDSKQYLLKEIPQHPDFLLQLDLPNEPETDSSFNFLLTLTLYLSICGILILWLFPLTRRLYLLNQASTKIAAGKLNARISPSKFSYIKMLEKSFNSMASQIEKLVADNKILARSLSHDIRTPMACLRFGLEAAIDCQDNIKKNNYLQRMDHELTRMEDMTSAFLDYASMERQALHLKKQKTNIHQLLDAMIVDCQPLAEKQRVHVSLAPETTKNLTCQLDYHWCSRALTNLITNAIGYAKTQVLITLSAENQTVIITIEDDGKGIAHDNFNVIFTPFVKLDADRSREQGHFGLGLAICTKVMNWHHGSITASNSSTLKGACFTLSFPRN